MSILVCRSLTSWRHRDNDWRLAPCRAQPCHCVVRWWILLAIWKSLTNLWINWRMTSSETAVFSRMEPHATPRMIAWPKSKDFFDDRIISKALWPPRSPDLSPPDFFLWGALKGKAYANKPRTIQELENNIRREIGAISEDVLQATFAYMKRRVQLCLDGGGEHFQHLL